MEEINLLLTGYDMRFYFKKRINWFAVNDTQGKYINITNKKLINTLDLLIETAYDCNELNKNIYNITNIDLEYILTTCIMELEGK